MDHETEHTIEVIRASVRNSTPGRLIDLQRESLRDESTPNHVHVAKKELSLSTDTNLVELVADAIRSLGDGHETFTVPTVASVVVESVEHEAKENKCSGGSDIEPRPIILYFHGGQFWRMGRALRWVTGELARQTKGRCVAVRYSLAPQHPFPTALVEGLAAYVSLLYPTEGNLHTSVAARNICFAGDSAGGNIALALLQLILEINRKGQKLFWNGRESEIPVPAGTAVLSPYVDMVRSLDSEVLNLPYDIIGPRGPLFTVFDRCDIWPAKPPRHHVYADDSALLHPLVSPVTVRNWKGAPPLWVCVGEECLADQGMFVAQQAASTGATAVVEQFSMMPHNFSLIVPHAVPSKLSLQQWASFIRSVVEKPSSIKSEAMRWSGVPPLKTSMDLSRLVPLQREGVIEKMKAQIQDWGVPPS
ncbi:uncharacterized protein Z520_09010 [Fonsecaea multimorphosa CBS 102226]|uniref:Alpha/beta hydrolase fold-3 domain-containing protein n=1 Tax=Fonsecaea multimorphosa CBS 102226 TaxID=1442371 RepID=A0A0D2JX50_9EURO|nr:uncharacterized protein Z520_09010 [Fonsecaea multimorphosa CBS 102226]KIX95094.1 hypothetical protein Z520_09010 [Fonsecaea multimorphosa CBS 102226]OAL20816.1 hypothetical protein AYO22_08444 [Fonsecaea multimorphosa]